MYDCPCEHCDGTVREKRVELEAFNHRLGFVILEQVPIGDCDSCGMRDDHPSVLRRVQVIATGKVTALGAAPGGEHRRPESGVAWHAVQQGSCFRMG